MRTQVAVALIAFLLLRLAHANQRAVPQLLDFVRLVKANLMHRRDLRTLHQPDPPPPRDRRQITIDWCPA